MAPEGTTEGNALITERGSIGHGRAALTALAIVGYFAVVTMWLPSVVLTSSILFGVDRSLADLVGLGIWGTGTAAGMWALYLGQKRGWM